MEGVNLPPDEILEVPEGDLVVFDIDSTLLKVESLEMAALEVGGNELLRLFECYTNLSTEGSMGFSHSLSARVEFFKDKRLTRNTVKKIAKKIAQDENITPSVLQSLSFFRRNARLRRIMCVSGTFREFIEDVIKKLGIPPDLVRANQFKWRGGRVNGLQRTRLTSKDDLKWKVLKDLRRREKVKGKIVIVGDSLFDMDAALKSRTPPADLAIAFTEVRCREAICRVLNEHPSRVRQACNMNDVFLHLRTFLLNHSDHA